MPNNNFLPVLWISRNQINVIAETCNHIDTGRWANLSDERMPIYCCYETISLHRIAACTEWPTSIFFYGQNYIYQVGSLNTSLNSKFMGLSWQNLLFSCPTKTFCLCFEYPEIKLMPLQGLVVGLFSCQPSAGRGIGASCCSRFETGLEAWSLRVRDRDCQWLRRAEMATAVGSPQRACSALRCTRRWVARRQACRGAACRAPQADRHFLSRREAEPQPLQRRQS